MGRGNAIFGKKFSKKRDLSTSILLSFAPVQNQGFKSNFSYQNIPKKSNQFSHTKIVPEKGLKTGILNHRI